MSTTVDDQFGTTEASERKRTDIFLESMRNVVVTRLTAYFLAIEAVLFVVGYGMHILAGPYNETANAQYIMAGIFGVFGILIGGVFALYLLVGILFAAVRAFRRDF